MNTFNAAYFIEKFKAIPDELWITGSFGEGGVHCASGHCGRREAPPDFSDVDSFNPPAAQALDRLFLLVFGVSVVGINDNRRDGWTQDKLKDYDFPNLPSPKDRVLAALEICKEKGL